MDETSKLNTKKYRSAAEVGDAEAQYQLGLCCKRSDACPKDEDGEKKWADSVKQRIYWFRKAGAQGHAEANAQLGVCYRYGIGVPKNGQAAIKRFCRAAEQGNAYAAFSIGSMYLCGDGIPEDSEKAYSWFQKSAAMGLAAAQCMIGMRTFTREPRSSFAWYEMAAKQGDRDGLWHLAVFYEQGKIIPRDLVRAYAFYSLADKQGWSGSFTFKKMMKLKRQLTPEQIRSAKQFARQFAAQFP